MRIIDLLNKIANGEDTPKKFKYDNLIFEENKYGMYKDNEGDYLTRSICYDYSNLNDEVEVIEDKKIEPLLGHYTGEAYKSKVQDKINEIIDYINKGEENGI